MLSKVLCATMPLVVCSPLCLGIFRSGKCSGYAAPTLMAGNTGILKHAANVLGCAKMIEDVFTKAGFPKGVFQNFIMSHDQAERVIAHDAVKAVTLTGSERAGRAIAATAGKNLKKSLLELGGNNAFIVWKDADIDKAVNTAVMARMRNCGQSCIAAKRFILVDEIHDEFVEKFTAAVKKLKAGDPQEDGTEIGTMARQDLAEELQQQVQKSIEQGRGIIAWRRAKRCIS